MASADPQPTRRSSAPFRTRGYVVREDRRLFPTEIAFTVNDQLVKYFPEVMDYGFTAEMENRLDEIANGDREWVPVLQEFYEPFKDQLRPRPRDDGGHERGRPAHRRDV